MSAIVMIRPGPALGCDGSASGGWRTWCGLGLGRVRVRVRARGRGRGRARFRVRVRVRVSADLAEAQLIHSPRVVRPARGEGAEGEEERLEVPPHHAPQCRRVAMQRREIAQVDRRDATSEDLAQRAMLRLTWVGVRVGVGVGVRVKAGARVRVRVRVSGGRPHLCA